MDEIPAGPRMTMILTSGEDKINFECEHATTSTTVVGDDAALLQAAMSAVMTEHRQTCTCQPTVSVQCWPSHSYALATFEEDASSGPSSPDLVAHHAAMLDFLRRRACPDCDPEVWIISSFGGAIRQIALHDEDCPTLAARRESGEAGLKARIVGSSNEATN